MRIKQFILLLCLSLFFFGCQKKSNVNEEELKQQLRNQDNKIKDEIDNLKQYNIKDEVDPFDKGYSTYNNDSLNGNNDPDYVFEKSSGDSLRFEPVYLKLDEEKIKTFSSIKNYVMDQLKKKDADYEDLVFEEFDVDGKKLTVVTYNQKRKKNQAAQKFIRYYVNEDDGTLYRLYKDSPLPYMTTDDYIYHVDDTGYTIAQEIIKGSGDYLFQYYTNDGRLYKTTNKNGKVLTGTYLVASHNKDLYLTNVGGRTLSEYIYIDPNVGVDLTLEKYLKGDTDLIKKSKKTIEEENKIIRDNVEQAKTIYNIVSKNEILNKSYTDAKKYSGIKYLQHDNDVTSLLELITKEGYINTNIDSTDWSGDTLSYNYTNMFTNPVYMRAINKIEKEKNIILQDAAGIIHVMTYDNANAFLEEEFQELHNFINNNTDKYTRAQMREYLKMITGISVRVYDKELRTSLSNKLNTYKRTCTELVNKLYS